MANDTTLKINKELRLGESLHTDFPINCDVETPLKVDDIKMEEQFATQKPDTKEVPVTVTKMKE